MRNAKNEQNSRSVIQFRWEISDRLAGPDSPFDEAEPKNKLNEMLGTKVRFPLHLCPELPPHARTRHAADDIGLIIG